MALFIARVELHNGTDADYRTLHAAMEAEGFSRQIVSGGVSYHLPTAEYCATASMSARELLGIAKRAANKTGKTSSLIVTQSADCYFELIPVK